MGKKGIPRHSATRHESLVFAREGLPPRVPLHFDLPPRPGLSEGSAPSGRRAGRSSAPSPSTLSRPGKFHRVSDSFVKLPLRPPRESLSPAPGTLSGPGLLGPISLAFQPRPADAAASSSLGLGRPYCTRPLRPPPFPGLGCRPASCCLIFSAIPFAWLYLTQSTPRRSLERRILYIAAWACPPCLRAVSQGQIGKTPP